MAANIVNIEDFCTGHFACTTMERSKRITLIVCMYPETALLQPFLGTGTVIPRV